MLTVSYLYQNYSYNHGSVLLRMRWFECNNCSHSRAQSQYFEPPSLLPLGAWRLVYESFFLFRVMFKAIFADSYPNLLKWISSWLSANFACHKLEKKRPKKKKRCITKQLVSTLKLTCSQSYPTSFPGSLFSTSIVVEKIVFSQRQWRQRRETLGTRLSPVVLNLRSVKEHVFHTTKVAAKQMEKYCACKP